MGSDFLMVKRPASENASNFICQCLKIPSSANLFWEMVVFLSIFVNNQPHWKPFVTFGDIDTFGSSL